MFLWEAIMRWPNYILTCILFLCITLFSGKSIAENFSVNSSFTFQNALNTAQSNDDDDTIYLMPGTYLIFEPLTYWSKQDVLGQPPHIENYSLTIDGLDYTQTILDGNDTNNRYVLLIDTLAVPEAVPITITIKNVTFKNAGLSPLGIAGTAASISLENCAFIKNKGGAELLTTTGGIRVTNSTFNENWGAYQGSGVFVSLDSGILSLENNTFIGNHSATEGGGAYCIMGKEGGIAINGNLFKDNHATSIGAGLVIIAMNGGQINLTGNVFENNRVGDKGGGACLFTYDMDKSASIILAENTFSANSAMQGGGVYVFANQAQMAISHSTFTQNRGSLKGGAVFSETTNAGAYFINSIIAENTAFDGGGIYAFTDYGEILITNTTCVNNTSGTQGGGVYAHLGANNTRARIYNTILWNNTVGTEGEDVYINDDGDGDGTGATVQFHHNAYAHLTVKDGDQVSAGNNITANPGLTSEYRLQSGSPCIDAGSNTAPQIPDNDMDFGDRIIDGDGDGDPIVDIGADEYDPSTPPATTTTTTIPPPVCMIRTIYGEQAQEVTTLRRFRDEIIAPTPMGNTIIALYYCLSSFMTETMKGNSVFKHEVKWFIDRIVWVVQKLFVQDEMRGTMTCDQHRNCTT